MLTIKEELEKDKIRDIVGITFQAIFQMKSLWRSLKFNFHKLFQKLQGKEMEEKVGGQEERW